MPHPRAAGLQCQQRRPAAGPQPQEQLAPRVGRTLDGSAQELITLVMWDMAGQDSKYLEIL